MPTTTLTAPATVTVKPVNRSDWPQVSTLQPVERCLRITLDPAARELSAYMNRRSYSSWAEDFPKHQLAGSRECPTGDEGRPGTPPEAIRSYHWFPFGWASAEDVNALLQTLAPFAAAMLDSFQPLPDRPAALDWTPRSAALLHLLSKLTRFPAHYVGDGAPRQDQIDAAAREALKQESHYITWRELHQADPAVARGEWALADNATLDQAAEQLAASLDPRRHLPKDHQAYRITSVRTGLYEYRQKAAAELKVVQAGTWYADHPGLGERVHPSWDEAELETLYPDEARAAANQGLRLVGFLPHALRVRDQLRTQTRAELRRRTAAAAAGSTPQLRTAVAALLLEVDSWGDPADGAEDRDARLGELAGMSPEAVALLRARIGGADQWDGWMPVVVVRDAERRPAPGQRRRWFTRAAK
ncbi:hypothetical protein [Kitasatospora sp. NPDC086791]|uniref:hypothetical protein n=1 Tax=Kitasatospora sp. NPDC086791 TaxID=3155178 RepID=UPI003413F427